MKKLFAAILTVFLCFQSASAEVLQAPSISAKNWLLLDLASGQVITSHEPYARIAPESFTKLMTAYLAFNAVRDGKLSLDDTIPVSEAAAKVSGSGKMYLKKGSPVKVKQLLMGLLVHSANDAAVALAEAISGSEAAFVVLMNLEAERMGMRNTKFGSVHGYPLDENYSTTYDLSLLATHLIADHPNFYSFLSAKSFEYNQIRHNNQNRLLWIDKTIDGMMSAHSDSLRYALIATAKRPAPVGERRMMSIVIGAASNQGVAQESLKLLNWGFQHFETVKLYSRGQAIATPEVWKGSRNAVKVGFKHDLYVTVPKGMAMRMRPVLEHRDPLLAPIYDGHHVATLKMMVDDRTLVELPVEALESVNTASVFGRAWDSLQLWMKK